MALGAEMKDVLRLVVRQGMSPVLIGLAIGLAATLAAGHLMAAQLYQISPHNPFLIVATTAVLAIAALLACLRACKPRHACGSDRRSTHRMTEKLLS